MTHIHIKAILYVCPIICLLPKPKAALRLRRVATLFLVCVSSRLHGVRLFAGVKINLAERHFGDADMRYGAFSFT
uniref:Secreted protein n=1 Tax=Caenorhabditis japonica TaxID=281687 RepID=A0A8R1I6Q9_CAEJA